MQESLLERIAPKLKGLEGGGYARRYRKKGELFDTSLRLSVAEILGAVGLKYRKDVAVPGTKLVADFVANETFIFVDRALDERAKSLLGKRGVRVALIQKGLVRSDDLDTGLRVIGLGAEGEGRLQTIFLDDPSFNFDYAHILPRTEKCSVMHGHTSSALVEIVGRTVDGMVIDFGTAKEAVRDAVRSLDHKLFINEKYVTGETRRSVTLSFKTVHGPFVITAPKATTVLLEGEATVENLANEVLERILPKMPENVTAVGVYVYEGLNKGAHLVATVHRREVAASRRKP